VVIIPAPAGGDDLVAVEREAADDPDGAHVPAGKAPLGPARSQRLRRVLDERDAMARAHVDQRLDLRRLTEDVHRLDGARQPLATPRPPLDLVDEEARLHVPGLALRVDQQHPAALVEDGVGRGDEGQRRHRHLFPVGHADEAQGDVDGGRAAGAGHRVARPDVGGELALEPLDERAN
jgi:hypothetical protein